MGIRIQGLFLRFRVQGFVYQGLTLLNWGVQDLSSGLGLEFRVNGFFDSRPRHSPKANILTGSGTG